MRQLTKEKWQQTLDEAEKSPLSTIEFCKQNNITQSSFYKRKAELAKLKPKKSFIQIKNPDSAATVDESGSLRVPLGCDPKWLARLMRELGGK